MKKAAIIVIFVFAVGLIMSSCNREICPAYSQADTEQTEYNG